MNINEMVEQAQALERERLNCMHTQNVARLEEILAPTFIFTHVNGLTDGRSEFLERLGSGDVFYHPAKISNLRSEGYSGCVVLNGEVKVSIDVKSLEKTFELHNRFSSVWALHGNQLIAVLYQSTGISV